MRIMTFNLPGTIERLGERKQGQLPAIAYIFGSVGPGRIDFQPTSSDFLNDPGQEIADSTNRGANDRQILAVDQAVKAGGDLAVVFVHEMRTLNDGYEEAALQAISKGKGKKLSLENDTAETLPQTSGWRAAIGRVTSVLTPR